MTQHIDRRIWNAMDPDTRIIHARLSAWAEWAKETLAALPPATILDRIMKQGAQGASSDQGKPTEMPDAVLITDRAISRLKPFPKQCVCEYYLRWEPKEYVAKRLGVTGDQLKIILKDARIRIASWVEMMEEEFAESCKRA